MNRRESTLWGLGGIPALLLILIPLFALAVRSAKSGALTVLEQPETQAAIYLSIRTTTIAIIFVVVMGFPLAYFVARSKSKVARFIDAISDLPIVLPPAAAGIALLATFGRNGWLGSPLSHFGVQITFTSSAVVIAQCFVALPFFVRSVVEGIKSMDKDTISASELDGTSLAQRIRWVVIPQCKGALMAGILLAWARALGEFGATLMFAGNFIGRTQTIPLAIYAGFDSDLDVAVALSVVLLAMAGTVLIAAKIMVRRSD